MTSSKISPCICKKNPSWFIPCEPIEPPSSLSLGTPSVWCAGGAYHPNHSWSGTRHPRRNPSEFPVLRPRIQCCYGTAADPSSMKTPNYANWPSASSKGHYHEQLNNNYINSRPEEHTSNFQWPKYSHVQVAAFTSGSLRHARYLMLGKDLSIILCHTGPPSVTSTSRHRCSKSSSVTASFSLLRTPKRTRFGQRRRERNQTSTKGQNIYLSPSAFVGAVATDESGPAEHDGWGGGAESGFNARTSPAAQPGRHAHPRSSPARTAIQRGAANIASSTATSAKLGFREISTRASRIRAMKGGEETLKEDKEQKETPSTAVGGNGGKRKQTLLSNGFLDRDWNRSGGDRRMWRRRRSSDWG